MCEIFKAKDGYDCHMKLEVLGIFCVRKFIFLGAYHAQRPQWIMLFMREAQIGKISRKIIESHT